MSTLFMFLKAIIIGFAIAAPVGPIGLLCIRYNINQGFKSGITVGIGAALADAIYGAIAGFSLSFVTAFLLEKALYIKLIGGLFLLYLGIKSLNLKNRDDNSKEGKNSLLFIFWSSFLLTMSNPLTILMFLGIFSSMMDINFSKIESIIIILGVFVGSLIWWIILSAITTYTKRKISSNILSKINYISAVILILFACFAIYSATISTIRLNAYV